MAKYPKKLRKEVCYFIPQMGRITYSRKLKKYVIPIEVVLKLKKKCIRKSKIVGNKLLKKLIKKWNKRIVLKACAKRQCKKKNK
jgi:hypothetical protein